MSRKEPRCAFCREPIPASAEICPHCEEAQPVSHFRELLASVLLGVAAALFLIGALLRLSEGPLPDLAQVAASMRFLEKAAAAALLVLMALAVRRG